MPIEKIFSKLKKYFFLTFFILMFNLISINFLSVYVIKESSYENSIKNPKSLVQSSSSSLPNKNYFKYYKSINIDHNMVYGTGSHQNFPVLISLIDSDLKEHTQSSGNDIAFANDSSWLDHEIEQFIPNYNSTHAKLLAWVRIPSFSTSTDTIIYMYYGNSTMNSRQYRTGVWDSNYKGVWHLKEDPGPGNSGDIKDSTNYGNNGTAEASMTSGDQSTGKINGGIDFDGTDDNINVGSGTSIDNLFNGGATISAWIFPEGWGGAEYGRILDKSTATAGNDGWVICVDGEADAVDHHLLFYRDFNAQRGLWYTPGDSLSLNNWYQVVVTYDDSSKDNTPSMYINGNLQSLTPEPSPQGSAMDDSAQSIYIGDFMGGGRTFNGAIDEIRLSKGLKSSGWIQTEYSNQNDPNSFLTISNEISVSDHPPDAHYFTYYKEIIIDHTEVIGTSDLINFSVLISLLDADLKNHVYSSLGNDIAFAYNAEWLDHELEIFDQAYSGTQAQLVAWVRIPKLSISWDTIIRMYYGNSTMGSRETPEKVWDSNYEGVWHLSEDPSDPSPQFEDKTSNNHDGTAYGNMTSEDQVAGQIDGNIDFDGSDDYVNVGSSINIASSTFSVSAWAKRGSSISADIIFQQGTSGQNTGFHAGFRSSGFFTLAFWNDDLDTSQSYTDTNWHYWTCTYDALTNARKIYRDGVNIASDTATDHFLGSGTFYLGWDGMVNEGFDGQLDEARLLNVALSSDWIITTYNNQKDPANFYSIGKEYPLSGILLNDHYFTYYKEITIDHTMVSGLHDLVNFPLLISISDTDLQDDVEQSNGNDIAFAHNGAWLDHEIERFDQTYNGTHAQLIAWVLIPRLSTVENTVITMYYGNNTMSSRQNPSGVWSSKYKGVWHLSEDPSGLAPQMKDSTANNYDGTIYGSMTSGDQVEGQIDGSLGNLNTDATNDYIDTPYAGITGSAARTVSFWISTSSLSDRDIFSYGDHSQNRFNIRIDESSTTGVWVMRLEMKDASTLREQRWSTHIADGTMHYIVIVISENVDISQTLCYIDGQPDTIDTTYGTGIADSGSGGFYNVRMGFYLIKPGFSGILDEVRLSSSDHSADWIETEYNNQYNPQAFLTVGLEIKFESTPPTYSNLIESSDPLELGDTEVITINVSDPSGINQVRIEFEGDNHSMTNIGGDTWQYDSWIPSNVDNYTYTIWMEDYYHNWNSTVGTIKVIDTTAPTFSDLIESADSLQLGLNETISIKVYDLLGSGVSQVLLEYESSNHTMISGSGNTWSWGKWKPTSLGIKIYTIYMQDMENNLNITSGTIEVLLMTAPVVENLTKSPDPLELGNSITIFVDADDNETFVSTVLIELESTNYTMNGPVGTKYNFTWTRSWTGSVIFTIYANDSVGNWNSLTSSFDIVDTTPPAFSGHNKSEDPLELGNTIIISINSTDLSDINELRLEYQDSDSVIRNHTMSKIIGDLWQYDLWTPGATGNWSYRIWAKDNNDNWAFISDSILVQDLTPPMYSDLTESSSVVELGTELIISINCTDSAEIKDVLIEYEDTNHTMTNVGLDIWRHNSWRPNSIGNYTYKIYITDINDNLNYVQSAILFQDTIIPIYSNLFESSDPLELGNNPIIRIDLYDIAGINQSLIEFEGTNHSMTNIYGNTWQYDSWIPNNWILYQYEIYIEDQSGNWNFLKANITVQDTTSPSSPVLTNSPSGDVTGTLIFDWLDGYDHSGIKYYILIIDNESSPAPGYVYFFNITNEGPESSSCVLPEALPPGTYYYFLAQIDGVGQMSTYTIGSFTVVNAPANTNDNFIFIIVIIVASVLGSTISIVVVRKRLKKEITPSREKISFKTISTHINKLSSSQEVLQTDRIPEMKTEDKIDEDKELEFRINEIKHYAEELFTEGAYLEALEQFRRGKDLLLNLNKEEEAQLFSELSSGIEGLIEEREKRLEALEQMKIEENSIQVFEFYYDIIEISKKLRDPDSSSYYQSELINYFQNKELNSLNLEMHRFDLDHKAKSLVNNNLYEMAAQIYEKC
ncbi:MAG: DUF2341 domain-containing protein, partial [Candidatus Thorarchaeota archaeon]